MTFARSQHFTFSLREKEGPAAKRWEDEGVRSVRLILNLRNPSPSHASRGPLPLPPGEVFRASAPTPYRKTI
jgi:hypothetical protein